ncbi:hypothetical protein BDY19DRAFT_903996 [Irpex rosettiformis]|uniref:Uncharacterized protein n=1 Tax=Irpex rosettiformis TaxID=378272 RepID=A0ACB8UDH7_9APHY|nr:hypothetical protein BDY19DRAFT_903996 [Irpex rosettiformis]
MHPAKAQPDSGDTRGSSGGDTTRHDELPLLNTNPEIELTQTRCASGDDSQKHNSGDSPSASKMCSSGSSNLNVIYQTLLTKPPGPSEAVYRKRLADSEKSSSDNLSLLTNVDPSSFTGLVQLSDDSYAARYLAGIVPYPSLPSFGSVIPSSESLSDILGLSVGDQLFPSVSSNILRKPESIRLSNGAVRRDGRA